MLACLSRGMTAGHIRRPGERRADTLLRACSGAPAHSDICFRAQPLCCQERKYVEQHKVDGLVKAVPTAFMNKVVA